MDTISRAAWRRFQASDGAMWVVRFEVLERLVPAPAVAQREAGQLEMELST